jgi:hypothetical protein
MPINETIQKVLLELKRQKKAERFPDHICAQANRIMCSAGSICENAHLIKYGCADDADGLKGYLEKSLISTMASCLRMLEELEK